MTAGRKKKVVDVPTKSSSPCPPPERLGVLARAQWSAVIPEILTRGEPTQGDLDALAMYCAAYVQWQRVAAELETAELLAHGPNGAPYSNPLFTLASSLETSVVKHAARLGLDTASRARNKLKGSDKKKESVFTEYLKRKTTVDSTEKPS